MRTGLLLIEAIRLITLSVVLGHIAPVLGQDYPSHTIKLVVPFGPGGPTDVSARLVAQITQSTLGQAIVIENRPGAGGAIGAKGVANADPDGYTLLLGNSATLGVIPAVMSDPGYDPIKSFTAVARVSESALVLVVPKDFPASNVQEFIAYAKAHPGQLTYASAGVGNQTQLLAELFKTKAGISLIHVPYKSGAEMTSAVMSNQVQMAFPDVSISLPLVRAGKLKALAVTTAMRHPQLPDVPTMTESGFSDFVLTFWSGVVAPAGTPAKIVERLNMAINQGLRSPSVGETLTNIGAETHPGSAQDFTRFIVAETQKWGAIARLADIRVD
jgi:tripartite-type tricarboxylate transporter receptor subunit TctC